MKAVVVEIENRYAAVLSDDGCIVKVKNNNYTIGQIIQININKIQRDKKLIAFAASAAAMVVLGSGTWAYASPYSYVSLDVNPSIEFTVNRFDRVLEAKAMNEDGEEILKAVYLNDLKNKTINNALTAAIEQISQTGYFENNTETGLVIAASAKNDKKAEALAQELHETVDTGLAKKGQEVEVEAFSVGFDQVEKAKELGVTPGKLNLVEDLQASAADPETIDVKEWLSKPVKEIMKATEENKKAADSAIADTKKAIEDDKGTSKSAGEKALPQAAKKTGEAAKWNEFAQRRAYRDVKRNASKKISNAIEQAKAEAEKATEQVKKGAARSADIFKWDFDKSADSFTKDAEKSNEKDKKESVWFTDKFKEGSKHSDKKDKKEFETFFDIFRKDAEKSDKESQKSPRKPSDNEKTNTDNSTDKSKMEPKKPTEHSKNSPEKATESKKGSGNPSDKFRKDSEKPANQSRIGSKSSDDKDKKSPEKPTDKSAYKSKKIAGKSTQKSTDKKQSSPGKSANQNNRKSGKTITKKSSR